MIYQFKHLVVALMLCGATVSTPTVAKAQISADNTLTDTTTVSGSSPNFVIEGGTTAGTNLFHSFKEFSIPNRGTAEFNLTNTPNVENIISRITGIGDDYISNLDGEISITNGANPTTNFFLLNPNGILFGPDAQLSFDGSFLATTADSFSFQNGAVFSASNPQSPSQLTISTPIGIQFGAEANPITATGSALEVIPGQEISLVGGSLSFLETTVSAPDGRINLGAVGANAQIGRQQATGSLDYNTVNAFEDIELGQFSAIETTGEGGGFLHVRGDTVRMQDFSLLGADKTGSGAGGQLTIEAETAVEAISQEVDFPTIFISADSLGGSTNSPPPNTPNSAQENSESARGFVRIESDRVNISGPVIISAGTYSTADGGDIDIQARTVTIQGTENSDEASTIISTRVFGPDIGEGGQGGNISIEGEELIVSGRGRVLADTVSSGNSGNLTIDVARLRVLEGGQVGTGTFGSGKGGILRVDASELVEIDGFGGFGFGKFVSGLFSSVEFGTGDGGNAFVTTDILRVVNGGNINVATSGTGNAGSLEIRANSVEVGNSIAISEDEFSGIAANVTERSTGEGGNLFIRANSLRLYEGGQITVATEGGGNAGDATIEVNHLLIEGESSTLNRPSQIVASSSTAFDAGSIAIRKKDSDANTVRLRDGAEISVSSTGTGNAGNLDIDADLIQLNTQSQLRAEVANGSQGNINLSSGVLLLRQGSQVTTNATGDATGGNIELDTDIIVGSENSDIIARAVAGAGGRIDVNAIALFGIAPRSELTPGSDINASSELGLDGTVAINNFTADPGAALIELPASPADADDQIATACARRSTSNQFIASGRGGLPTNPNQMLTNNKPWVDFRALSSFDARDYSREGETIETGSVPEQSVDNLVVEDLYSNPVEAAGWNLNAAGQVELFTADTSKSEVGHSVNCLTETSVG